MEGAAASSAPAEGQGQVDESLKFSPPQYYTVGEALRSESRHTEFQQDVQPNNTENCIMNIATKNLTAFLNTEGGTLFIGVDENCYVNGIQCDSPQAIEALFEKWAQQNIPPVGKDKYQLYFIQVKEQSGNHMGNTYVVAMHVHPPTDNKELYATSCGEYYIRRDGSCQSLKLEELIKLVEERLWPGFEQELQALIDKRDELQKQHDELLTAFTEMSNLKMSLEDAHKLEIDDLVAMELALRKRLDIEARKEKMLCNQKCQFEDSIKELQAEVDQKLRRIEIRHKQAEYRAVEAQIVRAKKCIEELQAGNCN